MRNPGFVAVLFLMFICSAPLADAAEPRIGNFVRYDTGDFVIITSRSGNQAREIMTKLVKFRLTLERLLNRKAARSGIGTQIMIVSDSDWEKYLQPRERVAGFFQRARFDNHMALNGDADEFVIYIMFHEYTHFFLSSAFSGEFPPWFNEGLAEFMGYVKFKGSTAVIQNPQFRADEARDKDWIAFDKLIRIDHHSPEYQSHKLAPDFYAQAWLTVHYGYLENREFGRQFYSYLNQLNKLVPQEEAARSAFGADLSLVDAQLRAYSRKSNKFSGGLDLGAVPEFTLPKGEPMSDADAIAALIDLQLAARIAPDRIRPLVESLVRREPDSASSYIMAARLAEFEDKSPEFDAAVEKAGKLLKPDDWNGQRELALVLLASADDFNPMNTRSTEDTNRDLKRALAAFVKAVEHNNQDAKTLWGLGTTLTRLNVDLDLAQTALESAYQRVPASAQIAISLANLKSRQEKPEEMVPYLKDAIRFAGDLNTRRWATQTLQEIDRFLAENARIDEENRKQREAYERDMAEYEKKYGKPKKKPAAKKAQ